LELETLKNKSKDLHNFVDLLTSERNDKAVLGLNKLAVYFIPFTLLVGFWSMGISFLYPLIDKSMALAQNNWLKRFNFISMMTISFLLTLALAIQAVPILEGIITEKSFKKYSINKMSSTKKIIFVSTLILFLGTIYLLFKNYLK
jgi:hypothetical protein